MRMSVVRVVAITPARCFYRATLNPAATGRPPHRRFILDSHRTRIVHRIAISRAAISPRPPAPFPLPRLFAMRFSFSLPMLSLVSIALGGGCLLAFRLIGSSIDEHGFLHEPFGLLPIGWTLILGGAVAMLVAGLGAMARRQRPD
ncbi:DUF3955 domain-containing protein [Lysobacter sp. CA199]|uniref:DUF3955 domain-containing protein n=1 Tax=Lysobacter sp. CA199 TaxID=3455608 RepID=UPI003F8D6545